jgi:uncharacterized protein YjbJ (UPF0337 family)
MSFSIARRAAVFSIPRTALVSVPRASFTTSIILQKTAAETAKDGLKAVDRAVSDKLVDGINIGGMSHIFKNVDAALSYRRRALQWLSDCWSRYAAAVGEKVKEVAEDVTGKTTGQAQELRGEASGKASELKGEAKGKASELAGKAQGKAEEVKSKLSWAITDHDHRCLQSNTIASVQVEEEDLAWRCWQYKARCE